MLSHSHNDKRTHTPCQGRLGFREGKEPEGRPRRAGTTEARRAPSARSGTLRSEWADGFHPIAEKSVRCRALGGGGAAVCFSAWLRASGWCGLGTLALLPPPLKAVGLQHRGGDF